ncbi:PepSY domain-containing protein [Halorussus salinisoli]|uniref:PepSY domain-containing protein n=1 Tax=Halorussus salinisoli TaxID=2558242 RepID=UPI001485616C|nr:PepSY domain-containing protein [Halorussus salinisoli]
MLFSVVGGGAFSVAATTASDAPADYADRTGLQDGEDNETEQQSERIPITEAMAAAQNETEDPNGTVVGAELGRSGGLLDVGDDENVYTVDVLLANGTHIAVAVNATNGSVVNREEESTGFLEGIFGEDDVPDRPINLSALYNATEAVELAQNATDANGTVTSVSLSEQNEDMLVYEVQIEQAEGDEVTVVVDAMRDGEGVIEGGDGGDNGGAGDGGDGDGDGGSE